MLIPPMFMDNPDLSIAIVAFFFMLILFSLDIGFFIGANFMVRQIDQVPVPAPVQVLRPLDNIDAVEDDDAPEDFKDMTHTREIMVDPVFTEDGQTYERRSIEYWFSLGNRTSPATGAVLSGFTLIPNVNLRRQIVGWKQLKNAAAAAAAAAEINTAKAVAAATTLQRWTRRNLAKQKSAKPAASNGGSRRRRCSKRCKRKHRTQTKR